MYTSSTEIYTLSLHVALPICLSTIGAIFVGVVVYAILVLALQILTREDLALMPKGDKIAKILKIQ